MSQRSPARSASRRRLNRIQASFHSSVRQLVHVLESGDLHPWVKGNRNSDLVRKKRARISCIRWTCPPKFILNDDWLVATGDQSEERSVQEHRESGVTNLSCPSFSLDVEGHHDDDHIPIIPITPIEYEEAKQDASVTDPKPNGEKHPLGTLTGIERFEADIGAAVSVALTALIKSNEKGSLIDTALLINILNDPKMIELLRVSRSSGHEKATTPQVEAICSPLLSNPKQELYMMQPDLDRQSVLQFNNPLASDQAKEGSIIHQTKMKLMSETLAPKHAIHSNKLRKKVHKASAEMAVPKSEQPFPQKPENAVHLSKVPCSPEHLSFHCKNDQETISPLQDHHSLVSFPQYL